MKVFEMAACFDDTLLDFASDVGEEEDEEDNNKSSKINSSSSSSLNPNNSSFSDFAEEELEWLSNKDAFPAVETSFVDVIATTTKQPSSASVTLTNSNIVMYCLGNVKIPVKARSKRLHKCREQGNRWWWVHEKVTTTTAEGNHWRTMGRKCQHCGAEKTPQWRAGPLGPKTLCNACGVRYNSGRLVPEYRPASSPTFSSKLHSNSHRKILEMRRHKQL
ncbi:self-incompatibility family protein [Hibiscus syriacus]|uniref:Self-incompatibility family protein n=1 Tax=Hibiscus syriacus TaxID=106335 RepID=A0A6A2Z2F1_HIBSY|nr:GATA transcription factor 1-like [Hibiscus syriacus]KAE8685589.1 self-incompatibility family protein [Hibiscus syriacus]